MKTKYKTHFDNYFGLRAEIDKRSEQLFSQHKKHVQCKNGCHYCCMDYSILPVEFYSVMEELKDSGKKPVWLETSNEDDCIFLENRSCTIYKHRPVICRTQGLPLIFMNEEGDWELSACELNFTEFDLEDFTPENTFAQDTYNSKLFMLNKAFIAAFSEKKYSEYDLIPIRELKNHF